MRGKFIVIDGTDGSGKKTQTDLLVKRLQQNWYVVEKTDFPQYGKKSAWLVENYLNGVYGDANQVTPYQASIFFAADRFDASFQIRKWLEEWKIVVSDRYVSANMWHQAGKIDDIVERDKYLDWLDNLEYSIFNIPRPDINVFLYVDPETSRNLALKVEKLNMDKSKDIHENDSDHMKHASEAFKYVAEKYNWPTIQCVSDGNLRTREDIHEELRNLIVKAI